MISFHQIKKIDETHGRKFWTFAVHFDRTLPEENPDESQMEKFLTKLYSFYEEINDNLTKCLLSHLMVGYFLRKNNFILTNFG